MEFEMSRMTTSAENIFLQNNATTYSPNPPSMAPRDILSFDTCLSIYLYKFIGFDMRFYIIIYIDKML